MMIPPECQGLASTIAGLEQRRNRLQQVLRRARAAGQQETTDLVDLIRDLNEQIRVRRDELVDCTANAPPPPPPLAATFTGTATITTTDSRAPGPFSVSVQLGLLFERPRGLVAITSFPAFSTAPFNTPFGSNITTVTRTGGGNGSHANGNIVMPVALRFDHSLDLPFIAEDSEFSARLTTDPPGSPVDAAGQVTLVGSDTFQGGILGGSTGTLNITGTISPWP